MRRLTAIIGVLLVVVVLFGLWKLRVLQPAVWKLFFAVKPARQVGELFVSERPEGIPKNLLNYDKRLSELMSRPINEDRVAVRISKSGYKLTVVYDGRPVKDYPVVFGWEAVKDKLQEGDKRTPEGKFKVRDLYPHNSFSKFIWIDYPTEDSWRKHNAAITRGEISGKATIGGEIGIHGVPAGEVLH